MPLPAIVGMEAAGEIVALPTDAEVLNHPEFKARGYAIGAKAIAVRTITRFRFFGRLSYLIHSELSGHQCGVHRYPLGQDLPHPSRIRNRHPDWCCCVCADHYRPYVHERSVPGPEGRYDSHPYRCRRIRTYRRSICQIQRRHRDWYDVDGGQGGAREGAWRGSRHSLYQGGHGAKGSGDNERSRCGRGV